MATYAGKFNYGSQDLPIGATLYGTCDTAAATAAKVATLSNFDYLMTGVTVHIKFTNSNTADNPTLKVGSTDAKSIKRYGTTAPGTEAETSWNAGSIVSFTYDGTYWIMDGWLNSEGGASDYSDLTNKPQINSVTLTGNKSLSDIGAASQSDLEDLEDITGDGQLSGFTATDLTGASNELKNTLNSKADQSDLASLNLTGTTNTTGSQIDAGTYFYLNGVLVKAKVDIANGATFTSGTNYEVVTVGGEISKNTLMLTPKFVSDSGSFTATSSAISNTGLHITIPANSICIVSATLWYINSPPKIITINDNPNNRNSVVASGGSFNSVCSASAVFETSSSPSNLYVWAQYTYDGQNTGFINAVYFSKGV